MKEFGTQVGAHGDFLIEKGRDDSQVGRENVLLIYESHFSIRKMV
jgi:hypothetical protein